MSIYRELLNQNDGAPAAAPAAQPVGDVDPKDGELVPLLDHLLQAQSQRGRTVFGFAGLQGGEGATSLVLRLAVLLSSRRIDARVLLIDANLTRPVLSQTLLASPSKASLQSLMQGRATLEEAVTADAMPGVDLVPSQKLSATGGLDVTSVQMQTELFKARKSYELVLVDLPPLRQPESIPLMRLVDGLYLVFEADRTKHGAGQSALERLRTVGIEVEGVLFNKRQRRIPQFIYARL